MMVKWIGIFIDCIVKITLKPLFCPVMPEIFSRNVQIRFLLLVDLTWTLLGNVSCMTRQNY